METDPENDASTNNKQLSLSIHVSRTESLDLYIYTPYWIINKTSLPLQIRVLTTELNL